MDFVGSRCPAKVGADIIGFKYCGVKRVHLFSLYFCRNSLTKFVKQLINKYLIRLQFVKAVTERRTNKQTRSNLILHDHCCNHWRYRRDESGLRCCPPSRCLRARWGIRHSGFPIRRLGLWRGRYVLESSRCSSQARLRRRRYPRGNASHSGGWER